MSLDVSIRGVKASFFDSDKVIAAANKGTLRSLSRCGAFVRTESKSSIKYATKSASPGSPPKAHRGRMTKTSRKKDGTTTRSVSPLKELIFFAYDADNGSVVVGPMDFRNRAQRNYRVPTILESGGSVHDRTPKGQPRTRTFAGNPFMAPALRRVQGKFPAMFTDLLRE